MHPSVSRLTVAALAAFVAVGTGCTDADVFVPLPEFGGPAGVITGTVTYAGKPPCTRAGQIVGAAILLGFEENLLPPPEGLGTQPVALNAVGGNELFAGIRDQLTFDPNGARVCPPADTDPVTVSVEFALSPLTAGVYEIRAFYDYDGNFNPGFSIFNLPTAGDVGGGAIANAADVLVGAAPEFRRVPIGTVQPDGTRTMPPEGFLVEGVSVTVGLPLPLNRPIFHVTQVLDDTYGNDDPNDIVVPADYQLTVFSIADPPGTEGSFVRLILSAGVDPEEVTTSKGKPFGFPTHNLTLFHSRQDLTRDGVIDLDDHIPETALVPALLPLGLLTRLADDSDLVSQRPSVILQGVTLVDGLLETVALPLDYAEERSEMQLALRPAVLCIDPQDRSKHGVLVNTHETDTMGNVLVGDQDALEAALSAQFLRPVDVVIGCLPQGRYAMNLVYSTGQAWTVPNESGVCAPTEPLSSDKARCGDRARLASQSVMVTIGEPDDKGYCADHPVPDACTPIK